jgi:hypothetical protein
MMLAPAAPVQAAGRPAGSPIDLTPHVAPHEFAEVTLELEAGGTMRVPQKNGRGTETQELPVSASANLRYEEHRFVPASGNTATRSVRYFTKTDVVHKVDNGGLKPRLSDERRLIVVENPAGKEPLGPRVTGTDQSPDRGSRRLFFASPRGPLAREELDLVDASGDSLVVDLLLPDRPVADGDTWANDENALAGLLSLDSVAHCEVESVLDKHNADFALARLAGSVMGVADGATTEIELRGIFLFDRRLRRITQLNLAVKEARAVGGATPGLDSVAKLRLNVTPLDKPKQLTDEMLAAADAPAKPWRDFVRLEAPEQGYRILHDRQWFLTSKERETITLRRVVDGDTVAQCTVAKLPAKSEGRQTTLEEFERDIRYSLGKNFEQLVSSRQWTNGFKHRCLEVVARGQAEEVPVEWHFYLVFPESGHRVSVNVTIEGQMVERLGTADRKLVNAIQLVPIASQVAAEAAGARR